MLQIVMTGTLHEVDVASATLQRMELPPQEEGLPCRSLRTTYYAWCPDCGLLIDGSMPDHVINKLLSHREKQGKSGSECLRMQRISTLHACEF